MNIRQGLSYGEKVGLLENYLESLHEFVFSSGSLSVKSGDQVTVLDYLLRNLHFQVDSLSEEDYPNLCKSLAQKFQRAKNWTENALIWKELFNFLGTFELSGNRIIKSSWPLDFSIKEEVRLAEFAGIPVQRPMPKAFRIPKGFYLEKESFSRKMKFLWINDQDMQDPFFTNDSILDEVFSCVKKEAPTILFCFGVGHKASIGSIFSLIEKHPFLRRLAEYGQKEGVSRVVMVCSQNSLVLSPCFSIFNLPSGTTDKFCFYYQPEHPKVQGLDERCMIMKKRSSVHIMMGILLNHILYSHEFQAGEVGQDIWVKF